MDENFYIYGMKENEAFDTKDGKKIVPVLMVNHDPADNMVVPNDWATTYLLSDQIDLDAVYVPHFVQQRDGSYKRKFRKVGE